MLHRWTAHYCKGGAHSPMPCQAANTCCTLAWYIPATSQWMSAKYCTWGNRAGGVASARDYVSCDNKGDWIDRCVTVVCTAAVVAEPAAPAGLSCHHHSTSGTTNSNWWAGWQPRNPRAAARATSRQHAARCHVDGSMLTQLRMPPTAPSSHVPPTIILPVRRSHPD